MARRRTTYNRTNKNTETPSQIKARREARENGRGQNSAFTGGARTAQTFTDERGNRISDVQGMSLAWQNRRNVATYTRSKSGAKSVNGQTAGGSTWTFTNKDDNGNVISQSGRNRMATRRQRYYDIRVGLGLAGG